MTETPAETLPRQEDDTDDDLCEEAFPGVVKCKLLGPAYIYRSAKEACRQKCGADAKAVHPVPSFNGPCVNAGGMHYRCDRKGKYAGGSASCCPCCEAAGESAETKTLCRNN
jgi:hypothetical protein